MKPNRPSREVLAALVKQGLTRPRIAEHLGIKYHIINDAMRIYGLKPARKRRLAHQPLVESIAELGKQGLTRKEIAERLGVDYGAVCDIITRYGLKAAPHVYKKRTTRLDKRNADIARQIRSGRSAHDVAKQYGLSATTVYIIAKQGGAAKVKMSHKR